MIRTLYTLLMVLALPVIVVYHWCRSVSRGRPAALAARLGFVADEVLAPLSGRSPIWVHAVSVGETIAVKPLLQALKTRYPERPLVLSNMTETGRAVAQKIGEVDLCLHFPFDYPGAARRLLGRVRPGLVIIVETEIWPNFLGTARRLGIPTVMVNGRISDRSFGRYQRLAWFFRPVLADLSAFCMQSEEDGRRIVAIGAPPDAVQVTRNLKYDIPVTRMAPAEQAALKAGYGLPEGMTIVTAGSTHPGEEPAVLAAFQALLATGRAAVLVLVPRHPERAPAVAELVTQAGLKWHRRSQLTGDRVFTSGEVLLVDTIGELHRLYAVSDLVFVGGSLVPVGGHNVLEPASLGVPVMFGPHMHNFRETAALMVAAGGAVQVADGAGLTQALLALAQDEAQRQALGQRAMAVVTDNSGATELHMAVIGRFLGPGTGQQGPVGR
jgi:3-deoxy-D-manno-octulosonic-acid transferase